MKNSARPDQTRPHAGFFFRLTGVWLTGVWLTGVWLTGVGLNGVWLTAGRRAPERGSGDRRLGTGDRGVGRGAAGGA